MYYYHPKNNDKSNIENFIEENEKILFHLVEEAEEMIKGTIEDKEVLEQRTSSISLASWNELESIHDISEEVIKETDPYIEDGSFVKYFNMIMAWYGLEYMKKTGLVDKKDGKYSLSSLGKNYNQRKKQKYNGGI
jgi:hypothetical protein